MRKNKFPENLHNSFITEKELEECKSTKPPLSTPPITNIKEKIKRKKQAIKRLISRANSEEKELRMRQLLLDSFLQEKFKLEEKLNASNSILPNNDEIEKLKLRLTIARDLKRKAIKKVNTADASLELVASEIPQGQNQGDKKLKREYMELKYSLNPLMAEVSQLKKKLQKFKNDVKNKNVKINSLDSYSNLNNIQKYDDFIDKLEQEKSLCEEKLWEANDNYIKAKERENKLARLIESLEKERLRAPMRKINTKVSPIHRPPSGIYENSPLSTIPFESGNLLSVSLRYEPNKQTPYEEDDTLELEKVSNNNKNKGEANCFENTIAFYLGIDNKESNYSETKILEKEVQHLAARYARVKRRLVTIRENLP